MNTFLQENILALLCFDKESIPLISNSIDINIIESNIYREIAKQAISYYQTYKAPISAHLPDVFADILNGKDKSKANLYSQVILNLNSLSKDINKEYVISNLEKFVRQQSLKLSITKAVDLVEQGKIDEAELELSKSSKNRLSLFNPGSFIHDYKESLRFLNKEEACYSCGIKELDVLGIGPAMKELFLMVALPGYGKTWFLIHMGKYGLLQKKKVLHITLEMSEEKVCMRYFQSLFSVSKNDSYQKSPELKVDELGRISNINYVQLNKIHTLKDTDIKQFLKSKITSLKTPKLIVKEFPTSQLTIEHLRVYLENLESQYKFIPDILIIDYADLMRIDSTNVRLDTGRVLKELRGLAVENNFAIVTVSQANRVGEDAKLITRKHLAEDYSKVAIADNLITFNQSQEEYKRGLARLYVDKGRNDRRGDIILIAQNLSLGQFCLSSARMSSNYNELLKQGQN